MDLLKDKNNRQIFLEYHGKQNKLNSSATTSTKKNKIVSTTSEIKILYNSPRTTTETIKTNVYLLEKKIYNSCTTITDKTNKIVIY